MFFLIFLFFFYDKLDIDGYLWIVLCITSMERNGLQIQATIQINRSNNISIMNTIKYSDNNDCIYLYSYCRVGVIPATAYGLPASALGVGVSTAAGVEGRAKGVLLRSGVGIEGVAMAGVAIEGVAILNPDMVYFVILLYIYILLKD
jgi:hypothetical protein